jgi:NADPH:quinone reductase-like Zn-dependent oxidoreductase
VGWVNLPGSYAERIVVPASRVIPIPEGGKLPLIP